MNTTETNHTPTPWELSHQLGDGFSIAREIAPNCGRLIHIATVQTGKQAWRTIADDEAKANAAFIVRACNEWDALNAVVQAAIKVRLYGMSQEDREKWLQAAQEFEQALSNLAAIRNPQPKLTEAEHNAFPKGRW